MSFVNSNIFIKVHYGLLHSRFGIAGVRLIVSY